MRSSGSSAPIPFMTHAATSKFTRQLVAEIGKKEGAFRVDADPAMHDRMAALNLQYPKGEWYGNVHEGYKLYVMVKKQTYTFTNAEDAELVPAVETGYW